MLQTELLLCPVDGQGLHQGLGQIPLRPHPVALDRLLNHRVLSAISWEININVIFNRSPWLHLFSLTGLRPYRFTNKLPPFLPSQVAD